MDEKHLPNPREIPIGIADEEASIARMIIRWIGLLGLGALLNSCNSPQALDVRPMHLRNLEVVDDDEPMIRNEQRRRFYGAIGVREQEQRLGHYYTVLWQDGSAGAPVKVELEYQQGSTGSRVLRQSQEFGGDLTEGKAEFRIIGEDYLEGGRVLAWRCRLWRGDRLVAHRQSYLWE
ncbi:MAG: hypothetical protein ACQKBU_12040 [Verrucomicrobiales bacterium]